MITPVNLRCCWRSTAALTKVHVKPFIDHYGTAAATAVAGPGFGHACHCKRLCNGTCCRSNSTDTAVHPKVGPWLLLERNQTVFRHCSPIVLKAPRFQQAKTLCVTSHRLSLTNTEVPGNLTTSPIQTSKVQPLQQTTTLPSQPSSAVASNKVNGAIKTSTNTAMSASEGHVFQQLGWALGRRGLAPTTTAAEQPQAGSLTQSSSRKALHDFWKHFSSLSWLLGHHSQEPHATQITAQHAHHDIPAAAQLPYDDTTSSTLMPLDRQEAELAAHMVIKAANSEDVVHYDLLKPTGQAGMLAATTVQSETRHTAGDACCIQHTVVML